MGEAWLGAPRALLDMDHSWEAPGMGCAAENVGDAEVPFFHGTKKKQNHIFSFTVTEQCNHQAWKNQNYPGVFLG